MSCNKAGQSWRRWDVVVGKGKWLVTKKDMAKAIAEEMGLTQIQAKAIVQKVFGHFLSELP
jgi:hypothetical protein